jgi:hypothetical protein
LGFHVLSQIVVEALFPRAPRCTGRDNVPRITGLAAGRYCALRILTGSTLRERLSSILHSDTAPLLPRLAPRAFWEASAPRYTEHFYWMDLTWIDLRQLDLLRRGAKLTARLGAPHVCDPLKSGDPFRRPARLYCRSLAAVPRLFRPLQIWLRLWRQVGDRTDAQDHQQVDS